jgi:hypothetical protein
MVPRMSRVMAVRAMVRAKVRECVPTADRVPIMVPIAARTRRRHRRHADAKREQAGIDPACSLLLPIAIRIHAMSHHEKRTVSGQITHVFGHRFVVKSKNGDVLCDITPHGAEQITLRVNDKVTLEGEMKPTELKGFRLTRDGKTIEIEHKKKHHNHHHDHGPADPAIVVEAVRKSGFKVHGTPRRKPKHFEVLGTKKGEAVELHVELDGHIRKSKPVAKDDDKWSAELRAVS